VQGADVSLPVYVSVTVVDTNESKLLSDTAAMAVAKV
jgi:hypothetical protein